MLTKEEIKHIAGLARIGIKDEEVERYQKELSAILDHFQELQELKTDKVEPIGHITGKDNVSREDKREELSQGEKEAILRNAPERKDNYVKVKSVL